MLAVGEDSVFDAPSGFDRFQQISVQLLDVVWFYSPVDDEVSFEFDVCVARVHVDTLCAVGCGWDLGFDFAFVADDPGV